MRIASGTRSLIAILGLIFLGVFGWMYYQANQTEVAYVFAKDIPPYTFIDNASDFLAPVTIPENRDFTAVTDVREIVGKYTGPQPVYANTLIQVEYLVDELPSGQRDFPHGLLPVGTIAYPVEIPENIQGVFRPNDLIDVIALVDEDSIPGPEDTAVVLLQKVRSLGVVEDKFMVALNYDQIAAYEGWRDLLGVTFTAAINQDANADFPPLYQAQMHPNYNDPANGARQLFAVPTPTPQPEGESASN